MENSPQQNDGFIRSVIRWAIQNSPAMNTFLVASLIIGSISLVVMKREVFPSFALEIILIRVPYLGATPETIEDGICQKIESAVTTVEGVKKVNSVANEDFGFVILELKSSVKDVQPVLNNVRSAIDQIPQFPPEGAEAPDISQIIFRAPAISIGIAGPKEESDDPALQLENELQLRKLAEDIREDLIEISPVPPKDPIRRGFTMLYQPKGPAISKAEIVAANPYEISVEIPEDTLRQFQGLSLSQIARIIASQNSESPGGKMETASQDVLLSGKAKRETGPEIAKIPILTRPNGDVVTVGDLGTVIDGFEPTVRSNTIDGRPGLVISVSKTSEEDLFTIVEAVKEYVANKEMPAGYDLKLWGDVSVDVQDRIDLLSRNGIQGLLLVFLVLAVFLELRLAFWVAMGIPISVLGAGFVLLITGQTLNMLTMFSFLMALGIVVDDAIVIGENIYAKREEGLSHLRAAVEGTIEVLPSVFASVTTTIIAFLPLMFVTGVMGKFISVMPLAVIAMLVISLVESTFILPAHLAHENNLFLRTIGVMLYVFRPLVWVISKINKFAAGLMQLSIDCFYSPLLAWSLSNRRIVLSVVTAMFILTIGIVVAGIAPFAMFPQIDGRQISATVSFPSGTSTAFTESAVNDLEQAFIRINDRIQKETGSKVFTNLYSRIGEVGNDRRGPTGITTGGHVGSVEVNLVQPDDRSVTIRELINMWRKEVAEIPGADALKFDSERMGPGGTAIELRILASDGSEDFLEAIAEDCKVYLDTKRGVFDIDDDLRTGKQEMVLSLNGQGTAMGMNQNELTDTIRAGFFGQEVMRFQKGRHDVKLMVRYPKDERESMEGFEKIRIRDVLNNERPLIDVAEIGYEVSPSSINRINQKRTVKITADVNRAEGDPVKITSEMQKDFIPQLLKKYEEQGAKLAVSWEGEQADTFESIISMFIGFAIALLCMFILLTLQFQSYVQPLIILSIIPFGWVGAILGHALLGIDLTIFSFFGLIALTGVVVNDSIVLVDFINRRVRSGVDLRDALISAGERRYRPIMLTSMTTIAGLFPMLLETSLQAQVLIPMAASLIFGLATGTLLILILVPLFYSLYGSLLNIFGFPLINTDFEDDVESGNPALVPTPLVGAGN